MRGIGVAVITSTPAPPFAALGLQGEALVHAEAVLLVDDGEGQVLELHVGLEQRVRADEDVDLAGRQPLEQLGARAALLPARQQRQAQAGGLGVGGDGVGMLARQHLGRRHQGGLGARLHRDRHGHQRHHRLAGADVALQQAQHAMRARPCPRRSPSGPGAASW